METVSKLEEQVLQQENLLNEARQRLEQEKERLAVDKQAQIEQQLAQLEQLAKEERQRRLLLHENALDRRREIQKRAEEERQLERQMREVELEDDIEMLTLHRLRLEEMENAITEMNRSLQQKQSEVRVLQSIQQERAQYAEEMFRPCLENTQLAIELETLAQQYPDVHRTLALSYVEEETQRNKDILAQLLAQREKEREERTRERQQTLDELQNKRKSLLARRRQLDRVRQKQLDRQFSTTSLLDEYDEEEQDAEDDDEHEDLTATVLRVQQEMSTVSDQLNRFKSRFANPGTTTKAATRTYNGELGIHSYRAEQLPTYHMARKLVLELVEDVLEMKVFDYPDETTTALARRAWHHDKEELASQVQAAQNEAIGWEILTDIINVTVHDALHALFLEFKGIYILAREFSSELIISRISKQVRNKPLPTTRMKPKITNGQVREDDQYPVLLGAALREMRKFQHPTVVRHTQRLKLSRGASLAHSPNTHLANDEIDVTAISLRHLRAFSSLSHSQKWTGFERHQQEEREFWNKWKTTTKTIEYKMAPLGAGAVSQSLCSLILGSQQGEIVLWRVRELDQRSPRPYRVINEKEVTRQGASDSVFAKQSFFTMSLDDSRVLTIDSFGVVRIWSIGWAASTDRKIVSSSSALYLLLELRRRDLVFQSGTLAGTLEGRENLPQPSCGRFFPAFTISGTQPFFVIGLNTGDILKCNFEIGRSTALPKPLPAVMGVPNEIGKGIQAELFRGHQDPILYIGFIGYVGDMISVDTSGRVFVWQCSKEYMTGFGWFTPKLKAKIELEVVVFKPAAGSRGKVLFTDARDKTNKHDQTKFEIGKSRKVAEKRLVSLKLHEPPWHVESNKDNNLSIFAPATVVPPQGQVFHLVTRHKNGTLQEHRTCIYRPAPNTCSCLLDVCLSPSERELFFFLLFPAMTPKAPHLSLISLRLPSMDVSPVRLDIPISTAQHQRLSQNHKLCSFAITSFSPRLCTDCVVVCLMGVVRVYSLLTGQELCVVAGKDDSGKLPLDTRVIVTKFNGQQLDFITFSPKSSKFTLLSHRFVQESLPSFNHVCDPSTNYRRAVAASNKKPGWTRPGESLA
eukprot:m.156007 g.156007  ORF g.156007 m.156007 type:complete len:1090 (-) comp24673_c0_seq7:126-3395(-)